MIDTLFVKCMVANKRLCNIMTQEVFLADSTGILLLTRCLLFQRQCRVSSYAEVPSFAVVTDELLDVHVWKPRVTDGIHKIA